MRVYPPERWKRPIAKEQLVADMDKAIREIPGVSPSISQPIRDNILEMISQIKGQVVIKVFGEDSNILVDRAEAVLRSVSDVPGVARRTSTGWVCSRSFRSRLTGPRPPVTA